MQYKLPLFRLQLVREGTAKLGPKITAPADVATYLNDLAMSDREQVVVVFLNVKNRPLGKHIVSIGTLNASFAEARDIFKAALMVNAFTCVLAHNHPSGEPTPSKADDELTARLAKAGALIGVRLLDHVILSPIGESYSYAQTQPHLLET